VYRNAQTGEKMNIKTELEKTIPAALPVQLNDLDLDPEKIKAIMINEVVPSDPSQDFYGSRLPQNNNSPLPKSRPSGPKHPGYPANRHLHHKRRQNPKIRLHH